MHVPLNVSVKRDIPRVGFESRQFASNEESD